MYISLPKPLTYLKLFLSLHKSVSVQWPRMLTKPSTYSYVGQRSPVNNANDDV